MIDTYLYWFLRIAVMLNMISFSECQRLSNLRKCWTIHYTRQIQWVPFQNTSRTWSNDNRREELELHRYLSTIQICIYFTETADWLRTVYLNIFDFSIIHEIELAICTHYWYLWIHIATLLLLWFVGKGQILWSGSLNNYIQYAYPGYYLCIWDL